ncbi:MAG: hypothetical protein LBC41_09125 [Clostridiales bacterium]|jgi:hypothetical protein|nr:hypothetical protein [Clostridiales bacterium]
MTVHISPQLHRALKEHISSVKMNASAFAKHSLRELKFELDAIREPGSCYSKKIAYVNSIKSLHEGYMAQARTATFNFIYSVKECISFNYFFEIFNEESGSVVLLAIAHELHKLGELPPSDVSYIELLPDTCISPKFSTDLYRKFYFNVHMKPARRTVKIEMNLTVYNVLYDIIMNDFLYEENNPTSCKINTRMNFYARGSVRKLGSHMRIYKRKFGISFESFIDSLEEHLKLVTNMDAPGKMCTVFINVQKELSLDEEYENLFPTPDKAVNLALAYCLLECKLLKVAQKI